MKLTEAQILDKIKAARQDYEKADFANAILEYDELAKALMEDPENLLVVQIERGWSHFQNKSYENAIRDFLEVLKNPYINITQEFDSLRLIGFSYELLNDKKQATLYLEKAIELPIEGDKKKYSYFELGKIYFNTGSIFEAEHFFKLAEENLGEEDSDYLNNLSYFMGFVAYFQKRYEEAKSRFNKLLHEKNDVKTKASGYFGLAHLYYHDKNYILLKDTCEKIIRLDTTFYDKETLGYFLCHAYLHLKMWPELNSFFEELKSSYPNGRYSTEYKAFRQALKNHGMESD